MSMHGEVFGSWCDTIVETEDLETLKPWRIFRVDPPSAPVLIMTKTIRDIVEDSTRHESWGKPEETALEGAEWKSNRDKATWADILTVGSLLILTLYLIAIGIPSVAYMMRF